MSALLKIGELSRMTGAAVETIRYYEREGLLAAPARSEGNFRLYGSVHLERLQFILNCRSLDMTLDEIRRLLELRDAPSDSCAGVNQLLDGHIGHVTQRIAELHHLQEQLMELRGRCHSAQATRDCRILAGLGGESTGAARLGTHGGGCH
jgi:Cd(II)/Pb(II)-responsive transcriptional regulator